MDAVRDAVPNSLSFITSVEFDPLSDVAYADRGVFVTQYGDLFAKYLSRNKKIAGQRLHDAKMCGLHARSTSNSVSAAESSIGSVGSVMDKGVSTSSSVRKSRQNLRSGHAAAIKRKKGASVNAETVALMDQEASEQAVEEAIAKEGEKRNSEGRANRNAEKTSKTSSIES